MFCVLLRNSHIIHLYTQSVVWFVLPLTLVIYTMKDKLVLVMPVNSDGYQTEIATEEEDPDCSH